MHLRWRNFVTLLITRTSKTRFGLNSFAASGYLFMYVFEQRTSQAKLFDSGFADGICCLKFSEVRNDSPNNKMFLKVM